MDQRQKTTKKGPSRGLFILNSGLYQKPRYPLIFFQSDDSQPYTSRCSGVRTATGIVVDGVMI